MRYNILHGLKITRSWQLKKSKFNNTYYKVAKNERFRRQCLPENDQNLSCSSPEIRIIFFQNASDETSFKCYSEYISIFRNSKKIVLPPISVAKSWWPKYKDIQHGFMNSYDCFHLQKKPPDRSLWTNLPPARRLQQITTSLVPQDSPTKRLTLSIYIPLVLILEP